MNITLPLAPSDSFDDRYGEKVTNRLLKREKSQLITPPKNYIRALRAVIRLTSNKENTVQFCEAIQATNGTSLLPAFRMFTASSIGWTLECDPEHLLQALQDRATLRTLPDGTLGRIYVDFMDQEGLDTNGLHDSTLGSLPEDELIKGADPAFHAFLWYTNLTHDLVHVATGYGRDALGELCIMKFMQEVIGSDGLGFVSFFGGLGLRASHPSIPVGAVLREATVLGRSAKALLTADWVELLPLSLDDVRAWMMIGSPTRYSSIPVHIRAELLAT